MKTLAYYLTLILVLVLFPSLSDGEERVDFATQIKPLLSDRCFVCHGPDEQERKGDLRLDLKEDALEVIVPGKPQESLFFKRIAHEDPEERMPPMDSKRQLSAEEIQLIKRWIQQGAEWSDHWAFNSIKAPEIPKIKNQAWIKDPLDAFIGLQHEKNGFQPAPETSKEYWIRRVTFDLTGLPPSLEEIDAFLADKSDKAYEKVVDRLLASKRYGERMTSDWLDVARYSDTFGYQVDRDRYVWPWRDYVLSAFNKNLPFDQFIKEQLAGDLIPNADDNQILATTFNRLHPQKVEGGSVPEEFRVEYVADRVETFSTAFLGLAMGCARCHDHKYDPISQKEYYQLFAYFNTIDEAGLYSYFTNSTPTPTLRLKSDAQKKQIASIEKEIQSTTDQVQKRTTTSTKEFQAWLEAQRKEYKPEVQGQIFHLDFEKKPGGKNQSVPGVQGKAAKLTGDDGIQTKVGNFNRNQPFSIGIWIQTPDVKERAVVLHRSRAWTDSASRGYQLLIEEGRLSFSLIHFWPGNAIRVATKEKLTPKKWYHVTLTYDGSSRASGLKIFLDGKLPPLRIVRDHLYKNITGSGGNHIRLGERFRDKGFKDGLVDELKVFDRQLSALEVKNLFDEKSLKTLLSKDHQKLSSEDKKFLLELYLFRVDPGYQKLIKDLYERRSRRSKAVDGLQEIMVMEEMKEKRDTFVLNRGAYDQPQAKVESEVPSLFKDLVNKAPKNRLELAEWLTDPQHPLTARVTVNRFWQMMFGEGLVRTPEDFGSQGLPPTHPQLLDHLSIEFIRNGWNVKALLKRMALSATYRQSSRVTPKLLEKDPENLWLARSPSHRWQAEMIRDNVLATSGLLVEKLGGKPARPYEVAVSFKPVGKDRGEGLYRRSVYTYWKRTAPAPTMRTLDASKRDVCRVKRERTSSPLQAFVLLNDPQVVEASRALGEKLIQKHGEKNEAALIELFRLLTSRKPKASEIKILQTLYEGQLKGFQADPKSRDQYLNVGEKKAPKGISLDRLAALATVANMLYSFDESVTKR